MPDEINNTAEEAEQVEQAEENAAEATKSEANAAEKKYTDADMDEQIQKRLARERRKIEKEVRDSILKEQEDGISEAEKLKNMSELDRAKYEAKKLKEEKLKLEQKITMSEMMDTARAELSSAGISFSDDLLCMFVSADADKTSEAINTIKELWPKELDAAVKNALKRTTPEAEQQVPSKSYGAEYAERYNQKFNQNGGK